MTKQLFTRKTFSLIGLLAIAFCSGAFVNHFLADEITRADVQSAAKIIGLSFTDSEIDTLLSGLEDNRKAYESNRQQDIPNAWSPALHFNPQPTGFVMPTGPSKVTYRKAGKVQLPANRDDLAWYSVAELGELVRTRKISSVELTQFFLERLKKYDPVLHCVISLTEERAMEQARRADAEIKAGKYRGPLHGIPYGAKDLLATSTYTTTWGAMPYKDQKFDYDAAVIQRLEQAGAVLVAKTTLGALAMGDVWFGERTRNPWDTNSGSSGSSAGSASAVAAGLLPFAIGTETLGSIVSPSTVCGTTGLRPTFGRVSRYGAMALSWSMDKIGPITRNVEDCAMVFNAIYGPDGRDLSVVNAPFRYDANQDVKTIKIGYLKSDFARTYPFKQQDSIALATLQSLGYTLIPIELPQMPDISVILTAEAGAAFDELTRSNRDDLLVRQDRNAWPTTFRESRFIPAVEYIQANRLRTKLIEDMQREVFSRVDVYINPSWVGSSLRITNYTGHPAVVLPNGFRNGRPTSITFTGKLYDEGTVLRVARAYQDATDHHRKHPENF
ncbi:MAG: amidase [Lewinellaceae bacterium]|nr:amidase [Lewinellaceae bacterium]